MIGVGILLCLLLPNLGAQTTYKMSNNRVYDCRGKLTDSEGNKVNSSWYASNENFLEQFKKYKTFKFIKADINDLDRLHDCDYVINMAAETHVDNSIMSSGVFLHSNINKYLHDYYIFQISLYKHEHTHHINKQKQDYIMYCLHHI